jgi:hypothetical protein
MNRFPFSLFCVLAAVGCAKDATFTEQLAPRAAITWLNAVSDTSQLDVRVVDIPTNAGFFDADFRAAQMYPSGIQAGLRHIRVFMSSANPAIAQLKLIDTTFTFQADQRYSFYINGFARTGQTPAVKAMIVTPPAPPAMGAGQFAIRVLNLAPSLAGAVPALADTTVTSDLFVRKFDALPGGTPNIIGVPFGQFSPYVVLDTGRFYRVALTPTGTTTPVFAQVSIPPGQLGSSSSNPIGGSLVPGTVLTAVIVARSVPGGTAPSTRPSNRATDTTVAEAARRLYLTGDTVTVQTGSISILTNRTQSRADSTVGQTGTGATTGAAAGDVVLVAGAGQPEYNGWQAVIAGSGALGAANVADSLSCNPVAAGDTRARCAASNVVATTRFRYRYRIVGTPVSPGTGTITFRVYPPLAAADFTLPFVTFIVDQRPPNTVP